MACILNGVTAKAWARMAAMAPTTDMAPTDRMDTVPMVRTDTAPTEPTQRWKKSEDNETRINQKGGQGLPFE